MNISATELPNFIRKYYLLHELLIFKYWRQNISVSNIVLHRPTAVRHSGIRKWRCVDAMNVSKWRNHQTSSLQLCGQLTVLTLTPSTTRFGGSCRSVCTAARFVTSTSWSRAWSKNGNISTRWSSMKWSGSGDHVFKLAFEHMEDIIRCADVLLFARTHTWQSITPVPVVDTYAFEGPY